MKSYLNIFARRAAAVMPQAQPIPGTVPNSAGGYAFAVDDWARLDRFLILGSEGGSYYAGERALTRDNAQAVLRAIASDGVRAVARIVEVSEGGRAPKNEPALFALALAASAADLATRQAALAALPRVARTGTQSVPARRVRAGLARLGPGAAPRCRCLVSGPAGRAARLSAGEVSPAGRLVAPRSAAAGPPGDGGAGTGGAVRLGVPRHGERGVAVARPGRGGARSGGARSGGERCGGSGAHPRARPAARGGADRVAERPGGVRGAAGAHAADRAGALACQADRGRGGAAAR